MSTQTVKTWWGTFSKPELKKFILLAAIFAFTIGVYWMLRPIKDSVFINVVGKDWIPFAKWLSVIIVVPLVMIYSKLVDMFPRHKVFYALSAIYGISAFAFALAMMHPTIGLANTVAAPSRLMGWCWYVFVESFGSIMVALFWAFAADTTTPESAKSGYSIIAMGAQLGGIVGPLIVSLGAKKLGTSFLAGIAGLGIFAVAGMIWYFMRVTPKEQLSGYHSKDETTTQKKEAKAGFMEGLKLLFSQPYLLGIFVVVSFFEIIATVFDFYFKVFAAEAHGAVDDLTKYLGDYGVMTNTVAFLCLVLGVGNIGRRIGLTLSLAIFPLLIAVAVLALWVSPTLNVALLIMIGSKGLNYAFNQPAKEQLYIPTTKETKYKAKAWIEMFGSRSSKAGGSAINVFKHFMAADLFLAVSSLVSLGLIGVWVFVALYLGKTHRKAVEQQKVVC